MVLVGAIASIVGIVVALVINWFPPAASTQAGPIDTLWDVLLIVSIPVFVLVTTVVLYSVKLFRVRPGQEMADGEPIHGNTKLEIVWTAVPAIAIAILVVYASLVLVDIEKAPAHASTQEMHVHVVGEQFAWHFEYKAPGGKVVRSNFLYLPVNKSVKFDINSKDVLHDFWVPAFRMKIDAVPGITTHYRVTPNKINDYPIVCAELCGAGHAFMRSRVNVMSQAGFDHWLAKMAGAGAATARGRSRSAAGGPHRQTLLTQGNGTSRA